MARETLRRFDADRKHERLLEEARQRELELREREMRQRELALREMQMQREHQVILLVQRAREEAAHQNTNVYISGLPIKFTDDDLMALCSPYGVSAHAHARARARAGALA
jgi:hypothetical protein